MADLDTYREKSLTTWDRMASGWEDRRAWVLRMTRVVNDWIHAHVDPQPGQTFLDIAAGPGDLGLEIAERLGDEGRVISSDFSSEMLEVARRNGEARGAPTWSTRSSTPSGWTWPTTRSTAPSAASATC